MADDAAGPVRILVVEDEYLLADALADALTTLGAQVVGPVGVLTEALALAQAVPIDGAVLDINLHGQMVFPLADMLAAKGVPYVFATGYGQESLPEGYQGVPTISKPVNPAALQPLLTAARAA